MGRFVVLGFVGENCYGFGELVLLNFSSLIWVL